MLLVGEQLQGYVYVGIYNSASDIKVSNIVLKFGLQNTYTVTLSAINYKKRLNIATKHDKLR